MKSILAIRSEVHFALSCIHRVCQHARTFDEIVQSGWCEVTLANDRKVRAAHYIKYRSDGDGNLKAAVLKLREQLIGLDDELNA